MPCFTEMGICYTEDSLQGIAYLDDRLYTVDATSSQIAAYYYTHPKISQDSTGVQYLYPAKEERITIRELIYAVDLEACTLTNSLFVCDSGSACIFKIDVKTKQTKKIIFDPSEKLIHLSIGNGKLVVPIFVQDGINFLEMYSTLSLEKLFRMEMQTTLWVHKVIFKSNGNLLLCWTKDVRGQMAMISEMKLGKDNEEMNLIKSVDLGRFKYEFDMVELQNGSILLCDTCDNSVTMFSSDMKTSEKLLCPEGLLKILQPGLMTVCKDSCLCDVIFLSQMTPSNIVEEQHHVEYNKKFNRIIRILKIDL